MSTNRKDAPSYAMSYDIAYSWGRPPSTYLSTRELVRLTIFRSRLFSQQDHLQVQRTAPIRICLEYDDQEGRLYCVAGSARRELTELRPQQRRLIAYMAERNRAGGGSAVLCTYAELRQAVWGQEDERKAHTEQEINRLIWELRRKTHTSVDRTGPFETVRGFGYRLHTTSAARERAGV